MAVDVPAPVRILIVDEEHGLTDVVRRALSLEGWRTEVAPTGAEAFAAVESYQPHVILLDMGLPDLHGTEVARRLRELGVVTPIVFVTGRSEHEDRMAAFAAGGDDYLTKPFGLDQLVRTLQPIVRRLGLTENSRRIGDLVVDVATNEVWRGDEQLFLSPREVATLLADASARA